MAGFAEVTSREASRTQTDPRLLDLGKQGMLTSVEELEAEQPELVKIVNAICVLLSGSGI